MNGSDARGGWDRTVRLPSAICLRSWPVGSPWRKDARHLSKANSVSMAR